MTTPSTLSAAIQPGSTEYGDRQTLEAGLATLPGAGGGAPPPSGGGPAAGGVPSMGDPLSALLSGGVDPTGGAGMLTDGLSVGPGTMPPGQQEDPLMTTLRTAAAEARSPVLRALARNELRRLTRSNKL